MHIEGLAGWRHGIISPMFRKRRIIWLGAILLLLLGGACGGILYWQSTSVERNVRKMVYETSEVLLPEDRVNAGDWPDRLENVDRKLRKIGPAAIPYLEFHLNNKNANNKVRASAVLLISAFKTEQIEKLLIHTMRTDEDWLVRYTASCCLGCYRYQNALNNLLQSLQQDENGFVRTGAAIALGLIGDKKAFDPLMEAMRKDSDIKVRSVSAEALGRLGDPRAIDAIREAMLKDDNAFMQERFQEALKKLTAIAATRPVESSPATGASSAPASGPD
ncbi:MAG: HEAT repeat domain-containing protein [Planctomycetes bacterium]|nr:HEAT repeat domain-containing protein [Planctomycetota bacterium]